MSKSPPSNKGNFNNKFKKLMSSNNFIQDTKAKIVWVRSRLDEANQFIVRWLDKLQALLEYQGYENPEFQGNGVGKIGTTGFVLGAFFGANVSLVLITMFLGVFFDSNYWVSCFMIWGIYATFLTSFHFLEFFVTAMKQPGSVSYDSFLLNHSKSYTFAAVLCSVEYWVECVFFGSWKFNTTSLYLGFGLLVMGQVIRSLAMWTCGESFAHVIHEQKSESSRLIKTGIYTYLRHPSYFGWFYWSVGTQLLLCNPVCLLFYTYASWSFFADRIPYEEDLLIEFYGNEYLEYAQGTFIAIPFISTTYSQDCTKCLPSNKVHKNT